MLRNFFVLILSFLLKLRYCSSSGGIYEGVPIPVVICLDITLCAELEVSRVMLENVGDSPGFDLGVTVLFLYLVLDENNSSNVGLGAINLVEICLHVPKSANLTINFSSLFLWIGCFNFVTKRFLAMHQLYCISKWNITYC